MAEKMYPKVAFYPGPAYLTGIARTLGGGRPRTEVPPARTQRGAP